MTNTPHGVHGPYARGLSSRRHLNKLIAHRTLRNGTAKAEHKPVRVYLQIASACNLDCYMCSEHNRPPELRRGHGLEALSREVFDRVAEEVFPHSALLGLGIGGEPMISENFEYFVERAHELGQHINLLTNGTQIRRRGQAELLARCVESIDISMDAARPETYERIRLGSRWTGINANIELLNEYRLRYPARERSRLTLCFVLMRSNVEELPEFVELAHRHHADRVHAHHLIPVTEEGAREMLADEPERYNHFRELALKRARELGIDLHTPDVFATSQVAPAGGDAQPPELAISSFPHEQPLTSSPDPAKPASISPQHAEPAVSRPGRRVPWPVGRHAIPCSLPTTDLYILYDGRVFPCCHPTAHEKMAAGDLRRESFTEIWNNHLYRSLRAGLFHGDAPEVCRSCSIVHDPPPTDAGPEILERSLPLEAFYAGREVLGADDADARFLERFERRLRPWILGDSRSARAMRGTLSPLFFIYDS